MTTDDLISRKALREAMYHEAFEMDSDMQKWDSGCWIRYKMFENHLKDAPSVPAVPLDKLCELLAEMYHCPSSGWPSSGCACHPGCPDEAFEKLCGTDCDKHTDVERWKAFLTNWMEELKNDAE